MTGSAFLRDRLSLYGSGWKRESARLWASPDLSALYPEMLKVSYQVIRASIPLLELVRDQAMDRALVDPVAHGLVPYLTCHIEEERGHDEWLRRDLALLGISGEQLDSEIPSPVVASMVGAQHYWARHAHPAAILGYLTVLEGEPPEESLFIETACEAGLPEEAFSTLRYHSRVDKEHWQDLLDLVDALPLTERHLSLIGLSILHTCESMATAIRDTLAKRESVSA